MAISDYLEGIYEGAIEGTRGLLGLDDDEEEKREQNQPPPPTGARDRNGRGGVAPPPAAGPTSPAQTQPKEDLRSLAPQVAERVKRAPPEAKEGMSKVIEQQYGIDTGKAFTQMMDQLGFSKDESRRFGLSKKDQAMFLMEFGMRMMQHGSSWQSTPMGAAGQAGVETLESMRGLDRERRREAMGALEVQQRVQSPSNILWTEEGAFNPVTGQFVTSPSTGQAFQPGLTPGGHLRGFATQVDRQALVEAGLPDELATRIAAGNAPDPTTLADRIRARFEKRIDDNRRTRMVPPGGTTAKMIGNWTADEIDAYVDERVWRSYGIEKPKGWGQPRAPRGALQ